MVKTMTHQRLFTYLSLAEKQLLLQGLWLIGEQNRVDSALTIDYWALRKALEKAGVRHAELASAPRGGGETRPDHEPL